MFTPRSPRPRIVSRQRSQTPPKVSLAEAAPLGENPDGPAASVPESLPPEPIPRPAHRTLYVARHPLALQALTTLRDMKTARLPFRSASCRLLHFLLMEATHDLAMASQKIVGAKGEMESARLAHVPVFLSVAPDGLGLTRDVVSLLPDSPVGNINVRSKTSEVEREVRLHLPNAPALRGAHVLLFLPVASVGGPAGPALNFLRIHGVASLSLLSYVASTDFTTYLETNFPEVRCFVGGVDPASGDHGKPDPGLGDFSARYYS